MARRKHLSEDGLTDQQALFVQRYLIHFNGTKAAIESKYSKKTAAAQASRLLRHVKVRRAIEQGMKRRADRNGLEEARVLREVELLAHSDATHFRMNDRGELEVSEEAPAGAQRAISAIEFHEGARGDRKLKIRLWSKPDMLKIAGRHLGIRGFHDKLEVDPSDELRDVLANVLKEANAAERGPT